MTGNVERHKGYCGKGDARVLGENRRLTAYED